MGKQLASLSEKLIQFIKEQQLFFVGTALAEGRVNVSPKGMDTFRVLGPNRAIWLNLTGSGNETAAHLLANNRITILFCAFNGKPLILRLYGTASIIHPTDAAWAAHIKLFPEIAGARQLIDISIEMVQTSCGMAVPFFEFKEERTELKTWAEKQGKDKIEEYWVNRNTQSIDGFSTDFKREV
jgi:predicted pyridoxine 5'-phosphate oxidase superfamily flavin-nucleotide-binding protein